jgi:Ca2+:H+ antiporter
MPVPDAGSTRTASGADGWSGVDEIGLVAFVTRRRLNAMLVFVPLAVAVEVLQLPRLWLFAVSALGIVPLAGLIGEATEQLGHRTGPTVGGLLNATFGNATELIIALIALRAGLQDVVKASISGSIIGNVLLVLGAGMFLGGWKRNRQYFDQTHASASAAMLFLAVVALVMPAVFDLAVYGNLTENTQRIQDLSLLVAIVLLLIYLASLVFSLKTHRSLFTSVPAPAPDPDAAVAGEVVREEALSNSGTSDDEMTARLSLRSALGLLFVATALTALASELLVLGIEEATRSLGVTEFFVGVIVVAVVGNAAEHFSAVSMAMKNRMDLAVTIATGSSTQIALLVAPVLVFASFLLGDPMSLVFNAFEIVGIALSVLILAVVSLDGESNWFEGLQLIAVYVILAIVFFFVPASAAG